jgi:hypothetical protein
MKCRAYRANPGGSHINLHPLLLEIAPTKLWRRRCSRAWPPSRGVPDRLQAFFVCARRFQLRARLVEQTLAWAGLKAMDLAIRSEVDLTNDYSTQSKAALV